ncbi:TraR/DksA family transcriptional regulator [Spongisporangium articulatum]|uniref:TraR/DksA family transcriptional regulator n=1 Tax=Spongisporangium articulatum TaxID=3362603 RepID=A0ABW8ARH5_9ACTN
MEKQLRRLLAENEAQLARLEREHERMVEAAEGSNADDEHDPEGSTIAFEREQLTAALERTRRTGDELRTALAELADGRYGVCERCGRPIAPERLEARPQSRTCIDCARSAGN